MKRRSLRSVLLATAATAAGLAVIAGGSGTASAANVSQVLDCGSLGGTQTASLITTAASTVETGGIFLVTLAPNGGGTASGAEIKNMVTTFQAPTGSSIVAGSATATGGSGTLGAVSAVISGSTVQLKVPGPVANGASFTNPTLKFQLKATGAAGTVLKTTFRQNAAYTLTAAGSINVSCNAKTPVTTLTTTTIEAAETTTSTTAATTTSTTAAGGSTTSTTAAPTTTTTAGPTTTTTTAPPTISTQSWSPGTACGVPQTTTAPANTISVSITAAGGKGGKGGSQASSSKYDGGAGGSAFGTFPAAPGDTFTGIVGCNGADGQNGAATNTNAGGFAAGGNTGNGSIVLLQTGAGGGGGGGASGVCSGSECASGAGTPLVVGGGGGGAGVSNCAGTPAGKGGNAGTGSNGLGENGHGPAGANGNGGGNSGGSGGGGGGGAGGVNTDSPTGQGGDAPSTGALDGFGVSVVGGGGGGGFAGGKQGQNSNTGCKGAGGGGGGSSWVANAATNSSFEAASSPSVTLVYTISTPAPTTTAAPTTSTTAAPTTSTTEAPTTSTTAPTVCTPDKVPFATTTALVTQQYLDFTGGTPTSAQKNQWVSGIDNCTASADALIVSLLPTDFTVNDDARLVRLYLGYFNRPPDPSGMAHWQRVLDSGRGLNSAAQQFSTSPEFIRKSGNLSNSAFVDFVYQNVLGRTPDASGKNFWLTRLNNKTKNRGDVMVNFSESSENVTKKKNHVSVFRMYRTMVNKFPSTATFWALTNPVLAGGTLDGAANTIRHSAAYDARV